MFRRERTPIKAWTDQLAAFAPQQDHMPWLKLVWFPGEDYEPVQRWAIYEMFPMLDLLWDTTREDLEGESPRKRGEWVSDDSVPGGKRWKSESTVSLQQWELFRETNCYPTLFWIIQGEHGGHKWMLTQQEQQFLQAAGIHPHDTPAPGDLPYAPFDQRVMKQLHRYNDLKGRDHEMYLQEKKYGKQAAVQIVDGQRDRQKRDFKMELQKFLRLQVQQTLEENWDVVRRAIDALGTADDGSYFDRHEEESEQSFIEG
jgi:hypothetical protein